MQGPTDTTIPLVPDSWHYKTQKLYNYWLSIHQSNGNLPTRNDFDPIDIPDLLSQLWMLDVHRAPIRFKFRILGTGITPVVGKEVTGQWIDEAFPNVASNGAFDDYSYIVAEKKPLYRKGTPQYIIPEYKTLERLLMPLVDENNDCTILLGISIYT